MSQELRQKVIVQPGGVIEFTSPELTPGDIVDVIVIMDNLAKKRQSLRSIIGTGKGCFATPQEADDFISRERDAWSL